MTEDWNAIYAAMAADKGDDWKDCDRLDYMLGGHSTIAEGWREAMHDRDRFQAERDMWREECLQLTAQALS